jgi:hypothetical protein
MRTLDEAIDQFAYHPATAATAPVFDQLRSFTTGLAQDTWDLIPNGPEKTLALRSLQGFLQQACLAVALTTPADHSTPHVARVLPQAEDVDV